MDFLVWHWRQNQLRLKEDEVRTQKTSYSVFHFHHDSRSCGLARTWTSAQWRYGKSTPPAVGASAGVVGAMGFDDTASRGILIFLYLYISDGEFWCELDFYNWQVGIRGLSLSLSLPPSFTRLPVGSLLTVAAFESIWRPCGTSWRQVVP